jgi:hypothetical protein
MYEIHIDQINIKFVMIKKIIVLLLVTIHFALVAQNCIKIITLDGELSTKKSLILYWDNVTKQKYSDRGKIFFDCCDAGHNKSQDSIVSNFKILSIKNFHRIAYIKNDKSIKKINLIKVEIEDTISKGYFVIYVEKKRNNSFKKTKKGDILKLTISPQTEFDYSHTLGDGVIFCITLGNIYMPDYQDHLSIATISSFWY